MRIIGKLLCGLLFWVGLGLLLLTGNLITAYAETATLSEVAEETTTPYQKILLNATEQEMTELYQVLNLEAGIDTWEGRCSTLQVVLNRVLDPRFGGTIHEVLSQTKPCVQYSTYKKRHKAKYGEKEYAAVGYFASGGKGYLTADYIFQDVNKQGKECIKVGMQWYGK